MKKKTRIEQTKERLQRFNKQRQTNVQRELMRREAIKEARRKQAVFRRQENREALKQKFNEGVDSFNPANFLNAVEMTPSPQSPAMMQSGICDIRRSTMAGSDYWTRFSMRRRRR